MDQDNKMPIKKERSAAEIRKSNKPLMEKRRRERINHCLDQLKAILMEVTKKESSYYSKLEKADILEMTVKYLKNVKRQQLTAMASDPSVLSKYVAGFNECSSEVTKYLSNIDGLSSDVRTRVLGHLANCLQSPNVAANPAGMGAPPPPVGLQQHPIQPIPAATALSSLPGSNNVYSVINPGNANPPGGIQTIAAASPMQLVPARLPSGDLVYLLTNPQSLQQQPGSAAGSSPAGQQHIQVLGQPQLVSPSQLNTSSSSTSSSQERSPVCSSSSPDSTRRLSNSPLNLDMKAERRNNLNRCQSPATPPPLVVDVDDDDDDDEDVDSAPSSPEIPKENQQRPPPAHRHSAYGSSSSRGPSRPQLAVHASSKAVARSQAEEDTLNNNVPMVHSPALQIHNQQSEPMWRPW